MALAHFSTQGSDAICASLVFCLCDISGASSISIAVELPSAMMSSRGCAREPHWWESCAWRVIGEVVTNDAGSTQNLVPYYFSNPHVMLNTPAFQDS